MLLVRTAIVDTTSATLHGMPPKTAHTHAQVTVIQWTHIAVAAAVGGGRRRVHAQNFGWTGS